MPNAVNRGQRWTAERPCPICGGFDRAPRGKGIRCYGYLGSDGKFAHCTREELAGDLRQEEGGTFAHRLEGDCRCGNRHGDPPIAHLDEERARRSSDERPISETAYDYEGGLRVLRKDFTDGEKTFVQYHRNGLGFVPGRGDAPLTLYRAPELRAASRDAFVFLVEGEKCVETLRMYDLCATTTPGGSKGWKFAAGRACELLRGRDVVILPDNDDPGRAYAAAAQATLEPVVRSLRVLELPRLEPADDVVDWIKRGGEPEELVRLAEAQPDLAARHHIPVVADAARVLWAVPLPPATPSGLRGLDRIIVGFRAESFVVLNGPPGKGKSGLALQLNLGLVQHGRHAVHVSSELSERQILARAVGQIRRCSWLRVFELGPSETEAIAGDLFGLALRVVYLKRGANILDVLNRIGDEVGTAPAVTLDYLQSAARRLAIEDRRLAVGRLLDDLQTWITDNRSTGLVVSSVGRTHYRPEDDATAEDFFGAGKEAGEIECDASAELFLQTEPCADGGSAPAKLHVSKHRFGPHGQTIDLIFDGAIGSFRDDPNGSLSQLEHAVITLVAKGARGYEEILEKLGKRKQAVLSAIRKLRALRIIEGPPFRLVEDPHDEH